MNVHPENQALWSDSQDVNNAIRGREPTKFKQIVPMLVNWSKTKDPIVPYFWWTKWHLRCWKHCSERKSPIILITRSSNMCWSILGHACYYLIRKVSKRFLCIWHLMNAGVPGANIVEIYCSAVGSIICLSCIVSRTELSNGIKRVRRRVWEWFSKHLLTL